MHRCVYTVLIGYIHYLRLLDVGTLTFGGGEEEVRANSCDFRERGTLDIIITNGSSKPIYEQIASQIKAAIIAGELAEGEALPSIRALANDLRISVITTKRAYSELEEAGFIDTVQGKGSFVAGGNFELIKEERLRQVEELMARAVEEARMASIDPAELREMLDLLLKESTYGIPD